MCKNLKQFMISRRSSANKAERKWLKINNLLGLNYSSVEAGYDLSLQKLGYKWTEKHLRKAKHKIPNMFSNTNDFKCHNRRKVSTKKS